MRTVPTRSRRSVLAVVGGAAVALRSGRLPTAGAQSAAGLSFPIGLPGQPLGDGFVQRHGFTVENTWYLPGFWHTGEDWYLIDGDTAGSSVFAVGDGEIVYSGGNYPGLVVVVRHADDLFSMYGHLDFSSPGVVGDVVARGDALGTVLRRDDAIPNHLHFEVRTFLQTDVVNGATPLYGFGCGPDCPPGPGYWPIDAPSLPVDIGWLNPTHVIANRTGPGFGVSSVVVATTPAQRDVHVWSNPADVDGAEPESEIRLDPGERFPLLDVDSGADAPRGTSAEAYRLWYRVALPDGVDGWIQGAISDTFETGGDGRPSTVRFNLLPDVTTPG